MPKKRSSKRRRSYPARRYRAFRRGRAPIPLLPTLAVANGALIQPIFGNGSDIGGAMKKFQDVGPAAAVQEFTDVLGINFLGYKFSDGSGFSRWGQNAISNYTSIALSVVAHKLLTKFGVNRAFRKMPFIGPYVQL